MKRRRFGVKYEKPSLFFPKGGFQEAAQRRSSSAIWKGLLKKRGGYFKKAWAGP